MAKGVPGPLLRFDHSLPCGCHIGHDEAHHLRLWYCGPHFASFDMLEALKALSAAVAKSTDAAVLEAGKKAEAAIKKAATGS